MRHLLRDLLPLLLILLGSLIFLAVVWPNTWAVVGVLCFVAAAIWNVVACVHDWRFVQRMAQYHKPEFGDGTLSGGSERGNRFED